jgi:carbonic anhydrase/acetyltransferase-like protein (isoleucine patch superfamily)
MILKHLDKSPEIDESAFIALTASICGDVKIGKNTRIMYGATIIAEGGTIVIGDNCVVLENAVLRSTVHHSLVISNNVLVGPNAHVVGCTVEENVFIATGAAVFHGARLCKGSEVRINGVVQIRTVLPENETVPINWVAVGTPAKILPPEKHNEIWAIQKPLNFPEFVYGIERKPSGETIMPEIMEMMVDSLKNHKDDTSLKKRGLPSWKTATE